MLAAQRQHVILQELEAHGTVRVAALSAVLGVSEMTVRRDIDALDADGLLLRVHGGATRTGTFGAVEPAFLSKSAQETEAKRAIATEALTLLRPDMTLLISGGTTTYEFARLLPRNLGLTVATNSIMVANALGLVRHPRGRRQPSDRTRGKAAASGRWCWAASGLPPRRWWALSRCTPWITCTLTSVSWECTASTRRQASRRPTSSKPRSTPP